MHSLLKLVRSRFSMLAAIAALAAPAGPALAAIYNFDFTGFTPSPVYDSVTISYSLSGTSGSILCAVFDGLNASGGSVNGCASATDFSFAFTNAGIVDGVFSVEILVSGDFTAGVPSAFGTRDGMNTPVLPVTVPEPATLALLGVGAIVVALRRRRA